MQALNHLKTITWNKEVLHNILIKYSIMGYSKMEGNWCKVDNRRRGRKSWLVGKEKMI
jgi:hypothetical protein